REQVVTPAGDAATRCAPTVFNHPGFDMAVLYHHRVVEHGHVGHAAVAMAMVEIGAEYGILLGGRHRAALFAYDIGVARQDLSQVTRRPEFVGDHTNRHAGAALIAGGAISDRLAA